MSKLFWSTSLKANSLTALKIKLLTGLVSLQISWSMSISVYRGKMVYLIVAMIGLIDDVWKTVTSFDLEVNLNKTNNVFPAEEYGFNVYWKNISSACFSVTNSN
jgi:hypothetical protein